DRVEGCAAVGVVVEVDVDVPAAAGGGRAEAGDGAGVPGHAAGRPGADPGRPRVEPGIRVAAGVQDLGAVQADVDERRGDLLGVGEPAGGVGDHEGGAVAAEQADERVVEEARVPHLEGVADRSAD